MTHSHILILSHDAEAYIPLLMEHLPAETKIEAVSSVQDLAQAGSDFTIVLGQPDLVAAALEALPRLQWVQSSWAGVTPLLKHVRRDYVLSGIKDTFGPQMAEYVLAYLLAYELDVLERLGRQANRSWWDQPTGTLRGKTLGIMGTGSIGRHIASMASHFGMTVTGFSRSGVMVDGFERVYPAVQLQEFLAGPDYIACVLPDTPETNGLLDRAAFAAMKQDCYVVNIGRGSIMDEDALAEALGSGKLGGAALDVFRAEPLPQDSPLWHAPGALVTAHVAAHSYPRDIARIFIENYRRFVNDQPLKYTVDFDRGY